MKVRFTAYDDDVKSLTRDITKAKAKILQVLPLEGSTGFEVEVIDFDDFKRKLMQTDSAFSIQTLKPSEEGPPRINFSDAIRAHSDLPVTEIRRIIQEEYGVTLTYRHIYQVAKRDLKHQENGYPKRGRPSNDSYNQRLHELTNEISRLQRLPRTQETQTQLAKLHDELKRINDHFTKERIKKVTKAAKAKRIRMVRG